MNKKYHKQAVLDKYDFDVQKFDDAQAKKITDLKSWLVVSERVGMLMP